MSREKIKIASLKESVMFTGAADMTIFTRGGDELFFDKEIRAIVAVPNPTRKKDTLVIPMENVKSFVPLTEVAAAALIEAEKPLPPPPPKVKHKSVLGVIKFEKDENGQLVEKLV